MSIENGERLMNGYGYAVGRFQNRENYKYSIVLV